MPKPKRRPPRRYAETEAVTMYLPSKQTVAYIAAILGCGIAAVAWGGKFAFALSVPERVGTLEIATRHLSEVQSDQGRRIDSVAAEVTGLRRELEATSRRSESSFSDILKQLASIAGAVSDVRDSARDNARDVMAIREKAANAQQIADEAHRIALENSGKGTK